MKDFNVREFMLKFEAILDNTQRTDDSFLLVYVQRSQELAFGVNPEDYLQSVVPTARAID